MAKGAFRVYRAEDPRDIHFEVSWASDDGPVPEEQLVLKDDVDQALTVLRTIFPHSDATFENYFKQLLSLAQAGLVGPSANPAVAMRALAALKNDVAVREGGRIKNRYMKMLGSHAAVLGTPALLIAVLLHYFGDRVALLANFLLFWAGCMAGVWLSFGARKVTIRFEDLHIPEQDRLEPLVRLVFAGLLAVVIGLLFSLNGVIVSVGAISTSQINTIARVAFLLGILCGFSEQVLSLKVAQQASSFLSFSK